MKNSRITVYDPWPRYLHACLLAQGSSRFEITMATFNSQAFKAVNTISSTLECSNMQRKQVKGHTP